jgi:adenylate kinase family enzyme
VIKDVSVDLVVNRINIIGPPGSGKTTLARELASIYNLPIINMDKIAHTKKYNPLHDKPAFMTKIKTECKKDKWIMEGVYKSTLEYRMPRADMTIYLDFPKTIYVYRVLKRRVQYRNKVRPEMPSDWKERIEPAFFKYVLSFHKLQKPSYDEELSRHDGRVITFKKPSDVKKFTAQLVELRHG